MIRPIDLNDQNAVLELLSLQQVAYRIEAELVGFEEIPPLLDSPLTLQESGEAFFGFYSDERLVGAAACKQSPKEMTVCRMMVHPDWFRHGIASMLLEHIEQHVPPGTLIKVATGTNNTPAVRLYEKHGYEPVQVHLLAPGITLTQFQKIV